MAKDDNIGYVYILSNPVMPGLVKIGMTERENLDARLKELYSTGVPVPFVCEYACQVSSPSGCWLYNDRFLGDIYDEKYPIED